MSDYPKYQPDTSTHRAYVAQVEEAFDRDALRRICVMEEHEFGSAFDMQRAEVNQPAPDNFFNWRDNGSDILAVAHLDTVGAADERTANFVETQSGLVVYSRALDDRLGAYIILDLLPKLGINLDVLLTVGEESGRSTAQFFGPPKEYAWGIEFDRGGTDVVMYQYEDAYTYDLVEDTGAQVGEGIFSDICYLEHLDMKCFNWGVGYREYHGPRAHAYLDDTFKMVAHFLDFYDTNQHVVMPHVPRKGDVPWWSDDPYVDEYVDPDVDTADVFTEEVEEFDEFDRYMHPDRNYGLPHR